MARIHWYVYATLFRLSASMMPDVAAVSVWPTCAVPLIVGAPVAGLFAAATVVVASLVRTSSKPPPSVNDTSTLIAAPASATASVEVIEFAPVMSAPSRRH